MAAPTPVTTNLTTPPQQRRCRLLELPGELRNRIYRLVVVEEDPIRIIRGVMQRHIVEMVPAGRGLTKMWSGDTKFHIDPPPQQPELTRTCTTIRNEALSIYYSENSFQLDSGGSDYTVFSHSARLLQWRKLIGGHAANIRSIAVIRTPGYDFVRAQARLDGSLLLDFCTYSRSDVFQCCQCHLQKVWRTSNKKKSIGARLLDLIRVFFREYTSGLLGVKCNNCELEMRNGALH